MTDKTVFLAGVAVTNGKAKFHTSGAKGVAAPFLQMPVPMVSKAGEAMTGTFAFVLFKDPITKLEAATQLLDDPRFAGELFQATLKAVVAKRTPVVKAPKASKEERKAAAAKVFKDAGDLTPVPDASAKPKIAKTGSAANLELIRKIAAKRSRKA